MQRRQQDADPTALNDGATLGGDAVDVVILSADKALIATLQEAARATHAVWHAPSADVAVDLLVGGRCGILIADLNVLHTDAAALLERLQAQFPELVLLATGRRDQETAVAGLISKGSVYRFLHKPVSPARASLFIATATRRYHELSPTTSPGLATVQQLTRPANRLPLIAGTVIVALLVSVVVWFMRQSEPAASALAPPTAVTPQLTLDIAATLAAAQRAFDAGQVSAPAGDSALHHYRAVLAVEADNATAIAGIQEVLDTLETQVTQALEARDAPGAARALAALQQAESSHSQLDTLRAQLLTLSRSPRTEPSPAKIAARTNPVTPAATPNLDLVRARLATGQLLEPADDSALSYLREARSHAEGDSAIAILATDMGSRLLARSRESIAAGDAELARTQFAAAIDLDREFELALPDLAEVGRQLDELVAIDRRGNTSSAASESAAVLEPADQLAASIALPESAALVEPAGGNTDESLQTIAGRAAEATIVNASGLRRTREVPVVYPTEARHRRIEGWVDLVFTIAPDGATQDLLVRDAYPAGIFDDAALNALRRWRFEPVLQDGAPAVQRARLRMEFQLK